MNVSVCVTNPLHMDYPLWRLQMLQYRNYYNHMLVSLVNNHQEPIIKDWLKAEYGACGWWVFDEIERQGAADWRSMAIKQAYGHISDTWIWFTEQDFFIRNPSFFEKIEKEMYFQDVIVYEEAGRLHPACMFVRKEFADQTEKDFSPVVDKQDHFYTFTEALKRLTPRITTLQNMGMVPGYDFYHMTGLTHNYTRFEQKLEPTRLNDFLQYNHYCMQVPRQNEQFFTLSKQIQAQYGSGTQTVLADFFKFLL